MVRMSKMVSEEKASAHAAWLTSRKVETLIRLPVSQPFTPSDLSSLKWEIVSNSSTENSPPTVVGGGLFHSTDGNIVQFDGRALVDGAEPRSSISTFNRETRRWEQRRTVEKSGRLSRVSDGSYVTIPDTNEGYYIGGIRRFSNDSFQAWESLTGDQLIKIDLDSGRVLSSRPLPSNDRRIGAGLAYIPVGRNGSLVLFGGQEISVIQERAEGDDAEAVVPVTMHPMENIWIYDIAQNLWHTQTATAGGDDGLLPSARSHFCTVLQSTEDKKIHNIYILGGQVPEQARLLGEFDAAYFDEVWILSLPSFTFFRAPNDLPEAMARHTCHSLSETKVLLLGGTNSTAFRPDRCDTPLMRIYDVHSLTFLDNYSPSNEEYIIPNLLASISELDSPAGGFSAPSLAELFNPSTGGGMSKTAIALTITFTITFALVVLLAYIGFRRRRQNKKLAEENARLKEAMQMGVAELEGSKISVTTFVYAGGKGDPEGRKGRKWWDLRRGKKEIVVEQIP